MATETTMAAEMPEELSCSICMNVFCEPVKWPAVPTSECGHSFCRLCLFQVIRWNICNGSASVRPRCPICREPAIDEVQYASPESLILDEALAQKVLEAFGADAVKAQEVANRAELERMRAFEFEAPLHLLGSYALRQGQKINLRLQKEHVGLIAHALVHSKRRIGFVLSNYPYVGAPTRSATLCGFGFQDYTPQQAMAALHCNILRYGGLVIQALVGPELHILSPPVERQGPAYNGALAQADGATQCFWTAMVREQQQQPLAVRAPFRLSGRARPLRNFVNDVFCSLVPNPYRECDVSLPRSPALVPAPAPSTPSVPTDAEFVED